MTSTILIGLIAFVFVSSITPGPNNVMLMASGATYGFRPTLPLLAGVIVGVGTVVLVIGWGLAGVFAVAPWLHNVIRAAGALYLLFLAYKIATAQGLTEGEASTQPITFRQAVMFQWVNPKLWTIAIGAITAYVPTAGLFQNVAIVALIFVLIAVPCATIWAAFGVGLGSVLKQPLALRAFNIGMAALLVLSLYPILREMI